MELQPADVARWLDISTSTVRVWSREFSDYLSDSAVGGDGKHRVYSTDDVQRMAFIRSLRKAGNSTADIRETLAKLAADGWEHLPPLPPAPPDVETGPPIPETVVKTQLAAREQVLLKEIGLKDTQIFDLSDRLQAEQDAHNETRAALADTREQLGEAHGKLSILPTYRTMLIAAAVVAAVLLAAVLFLALGGGA